MSRRRCVLNWLRSRAVAIVLVVLVAVALGVYAGITLRSIDRAAEVRAQIAAQGDQIAAQGAYLVECTTRGPRQPTPDDPSTGHPCYDEGAATTRDAIKQIWVSLDCNTLYQQGEQPAGCEDVVRRIEILRSGGRL